MVLGKFIRGLFRRWAHVSEGPPRTSRGPISHVVILDGTMSTLEPGRESNAGLSYKLISEAARKERISLFYEAGVQWRSWSETLDVIEGRGINRQIRRAYGFIASRYRPGDRIYLVGYSRGAFAVRSLAGAIDQIGLLKPEHATVRMIRQAYRHYECSPTSDAAAEFSRHYCHHESPIDMVGVWDTVKALGFRAPLLWRLSEARHAFHNHELGSSIQHGFHALALNETREAYEPVLWTTTPGHEGRVEQVWFAGSHGDVGGQLGGFEAARSLSNIPLVWMLEKLETCGLPMPDRWRDRFECDPSAPSVGTMRGWGKYFLLRKRRVVGMDPSERLHHTVGDADVRDDVPDALRTA